MIKARIAIFLAATFMATVGLFVKFMPLSVAGIVEFRGLFGFAWVSVFLLAMRKGGAVAKLLRYKKVLAFSMAMTVLTILFYFLAIDLVGLGTAAFLLYVGNLVAVLFMRVFLKERQPRIIYVSYGLAIAGVFLIVKPWEGFSISIGILFGICSALMLGTLNLSKKIMFRLVESDARSGKPSLPELTIGLTWYTTLGLSITFFYTLFTESSIAFTIDAILPGLLLGLVPTALAFTLFNVGLVKDTGGNVLILSYAEPFIAMLLDIIVFGNFSAMVFLGGTCIIIANVLVARIKQESLAPTRSP